MGNVRARIRSVMQGTIETSPSFNASNATYLASNAKARADSTAPNVKMAHSLIASWANAEPAIKIASLAQDL